MTLASILLLAVLPARGADPVLHAGDAAAALERAARDAGRAPEELSPMTLTELLRGRPTILRGSGTVEVCARAPAGASAFGEALSRADSAMAFLEYDKALKELDEAAEVLGCLATPADPASAARMHYLRGLVFFFSQETLAARGAWVQAHRFARDLAWDDNFPPDGKPLFEEAREAAAADAPTTLSLVPPLGEERLWVDGKQMTLSEGRVSVPAGDHLVQYGGVSVTTVRLTLDPGADATLVFPHAVNDEDIAWVADAGGRTVLSEVLSAALGPDAVVYAVYTDQVWAGTAGSADWVPLDPVPVGPVEPEPPPRPRTWYVAASGAGLAGAAGISTLTSYLVAKRHQAEAQEAVDRNDEQDFQEHKAKYESARTAYKVSMGVAIGGLVVGAAGLAIPVADGVSVGLHPAGLVLNVRR